MCWKKILGFVVVIGLMAAFFVSTVEATPAFARKYGTTCMTCHFGAFPKLNDVGKAFKTRGYDHPSLTETDESLDQEVGLGSEVYKRVWPKAIWPGSLSDLPLAFRLRMTYDSDSKNLKPELFILSNGLLGDKFSFGLHLHNSDSEGFGLGRVWGQVNDLLNKRDKGYVLNLKVGKDESPVTFSSFYDSLSLTNYAVRTYTPSMDNSFGGAGGHEHGGFSLGSSKTGIGVEFTMKRLQLYGGVLNSDEDLKVSGRKDLYARASYKLLGDLPYGVSSGGGNHSLVIGAFGYWGENVVAENGHDGDSDHGDEDGDDDHGDEDGDDDHGDDDGDDDHDMDMGQDVHSLPVTFMGSDITNYTRMGFDLDYSYKQTLNLQSSVMFAKDNLADGLEEKDLNAFVWSSRLHLVSSYTWITPYTGFDLINRDYGVYDVSDSMARGIFGTSFSIRPNIKVNVEVVTPIKGADKDDTKFIMGFDFAF